MNLCKPNFIQLLANAQIFIPNIAHVKKLICAEAF